MPSPSPNPSPTPSIGSASFLYVGIAANQGGVQGFHIDPTSGALAEVPGSPILFDDGGAATGFSQAGPIAAAQGHVFVGFGPPNFAPPVIRSYAVDPTSGSLGNFVETNAGAVNGDEQIRTLVTDPAGRRLYAVYQNNIASFEINQDGSLLFLGNATNLAAASIFSLTIDPAANFAFLGVDNCPPKGPCTGPPNILLLNRDPATGLLLNTGRQLLSAGNLPSPGALTIDPSGTHLIASTITASGAPQISVFHIDSGGGLTPAGSPLSTPDGLVPFGFRFDFTGKFLYVLNSSLIFPQPEAVTVYAFNQQSGSLQQLHSQSLPSGNFASTLVVTSSFVFVINSQSGTVPSVIHVLSRDANTGIVSGPVFTQPDRPGGTQAGLGDAVVISF